MKKLLLAVAVVVVLVVLGAGGAWMWINAGARGAVGPADAADVSFVVEKGSTG